MPQLSHLINGHNSSSCLALGPETEWLGLRERQPPVGLTEPMEIQESVGQLGILASPRAPWALSDLAGGLWLIMRLVSQDLPCSQPFSSFPELGLEPESYPPPVF